MPKERPCEETIPPAPLLSTGSGGLMGWEGTEARPISASQGVWEDARSEGFAVKVQGERGFGWILAAAALREISIGRAVELFGSLEGRRGEQRPVPGPRSFPPCDVLLRAQASSGTFPGPGDAGKTSFRTG